MEVVKVLHMKGGKGDTSYARNSLMQKQVIQMTKPVREEAIANLCNATITCLNIADLGCSSGPNAVFVASEVIETAYNLYRERERKSMEFHVFLNDLPGNDFNTLFQTIPSILESVRNRTGADLGRCFFTGVPGSFYGRLFPTNSLHFVHSSYSLHWLSQRNKGKQRKHLRVEDKSTQPFQFQKDFSTFFKCRGEEVVDGGCMILTFLGRRNDEPSSQDSCRLWELLGMALSQMVAGGIIEEDKLDAFNIPTYFPSPPEVKGEIVKEGSFAIKGLEVSTISWNGYYDNGDEMKVSNELFESGSYVEKYMRAVAEPLLVSHFGEDIIDNVFSKYRKIIADCMKKEKPEFVNIVVSLARRVNLS